MQERSALVIACVLAATALAAVAIATSPSGVLSGVVVARAGFVDRVDIKFAVEDGIRGTKVIGVNGAQDTVVHSSAPGGGTCTSRAI